MSDASVRTARVADAEAVGTVQAAVWRAAYQELLDPRIVAAFVPDPFTRAWEESLRNPPTTLHRLLVATELDAIVGFAAMAPAETEGTAELLAMGVHPEHRGRGHGSRLLNATVDTLRAGDFEHLQLWLLTSDESTRRFLEKAGLAADGSWHDRVIDPDGTTAREIRLAASIAPADEAGAD